MPATAIVALHVSDTLGNMTHYSICVRLPRVAQGSKSVVAVAGIFTRIFEVNFVSVNVFKLLRFSYKCL
jgi:hypothetical protein